MRWIFAFLFISLNYMCFAQRSEIGGMLGGTYYIGDINPKDHFQATHPAAGLIYRYNFNPRFAFKGNFYYGRISGDDNKSGYNFYRNLNFRSSLADFTGELEFNFFSFITGNKKTPSTPYVFFGLGVAKFNPQAKHNGIWYELQPLGTEGQGTSMYPDRKKYALTAFTIPFGVGFKFNIGRSTCIGLEYGLRKTYTDYLDDISTTYADSIILASENTLLSAILADRADPPRAIDSQRGNSKNTDWYSYFGISANFRIKFSRTTCPAYGLKKKNLLRDYNN